MLQLECIRFGTASLATQLESTHFGRYSCNATSMHPVPCPYFSLESTRFSTAILAPQLESIRFAFPLFVHNIKASDLVLLLLHQAAAVVT